ncbi:MAG: hypothetical protein MJ169_05080 [Treponema sp.]|nr:hypothetical protein [Treponema sp.]
MSKKKSKKQSESVSLWKKIPAKFKIAGISVIAAAVILFGLFTFLSCWNKYKVTTIAFYDLPQDVIEPVSAQISFANPEAKFVIYQKAFDLKNFNKIQKKLKKASVVISYNPPAFETLEFPQSFYSSMPVSFTVNLDRTQLPLLLNHFEVSFYNTLQQELKLELPQNYTQFVDYLTAAKEYIPNPLFCNGADDTNLLWMVSAVANSIYSNEELTAHLKVIRNTNSPKYIKRFQEKSSITPANSQATQTVLIELKDALDEIKRLQSLGLIHEQWYSATTADMNLLLRNNMVAVLAMPLSQHRTIPYNTIKYFTTLPLPVNGSSSEHRLTAPAVNAWLVTSTPQNLASIEPLLDNYKQGVMSTVSGLAPSALRAEAGDRQSDNVRFWAASCQGPVNPLDLFAGMDPQQSGIVANAIREYLSKNN